MPLPAMFALVVVWNAVANQQGFLAMAGVLGLTKPQAKRFAERISNATEEQTAMIRAICQEVAEYD